MAKIIGTPDPDQLDGTDENDLIRGRAGDDTIFGNLGEDRLYGDSGNDTVFGLSVDGSEIRGGRGDDHLYLVRGYAYGGVGDDFISVGGDGSAYGCKGDDTLVGRDSLWGDERPDAPEHVAGNDTLKLNADADSAWAHGGLGNDQFQVLIEPLGAPPNLGIIDDFHPGEDKFGVIADLGHDEPADMFSVYDANIDGVLDWQDGPAGGGVYVDAASSTMFLLHGSSAIILHGAIQITAADWLT